MERESEVGNMSTSTKTTSGNAVAHPSHYCPCGILAVEIENEEGQEEYGISFAGPNPDEDEYVAMVDEASAVKLVGLLQLWCPQSRLTAQGLVWVDHVTNSSGSK